MNAQPEATAAMAIPLGQDLDHFQFADDMLADDALNGEFAIAPFICFAHLTAVGILDGRATLGGPLLQPLIPTIA
jgi:hypothetical protein